MRSTRHRITRLCGLASWMALVGMVVWPGACTSGGMHQEDALVIWINSDKGYNGLDQIGRVFTRVTGMPVIVEHPQDATNKFQQAASSGKGPDIFIWPQDRLGEWQEGGLVAEIQPSAYVLSTYEQKGWDAFTIGGRMWGYPIAFETVTLIYNKALVPVPPASFSEIPAIDRRLEQSSRGATRAILWDFTNVYFSFALLAARGGYPFKRRPSGTYDARDVGVNNPGAVRGLEVLVDLVRSGIMPPSASYNDAEAGMANGRLGMMIGGAWSWSNLERRGIDYGVARIPAVDSAPSRPFVGVLGAMINQASDKKDVAVEFIENYLLEPRYLKLMNADKPIGVPANRQYYRELAGDPRIRTTMLSVRDGVIMPNNPEMGRFWSAMDTALQNATQGRQSPRDALDMAARRILQSF